MTKIQMTINGQSFPASLNNSAAAQALLHQLPVTLVMEDLNGNEKYIYLDEKLAANSIAFGVGWRSDVVRQQLSGAVLQKLYDGLFLYLAGLDQRGFRISGSGRYRSG